MKKITAVLSLCICFLWATQTVKAQGIEFKVELLSDRITYKVSMKPSITWTAPNDNTLGAQVTLVVATGGFQINNLTSINGVWDKLPTIIAPTERPSKDYFVIYLTTSTALPYTANAEIPLFTFQNTGVCTGILDLIHNASDPFMPPNAQSLNVGNYLTTTGGGGSSNNLWTGNYGAAADCRPCQMEYKLTPLSTGKYQVSMIPKTTWSGPLATTATQQVTIVAPTGGFQAANLTNLVFGVNYGQTSRFNAPIENPTKDYLLFTLNSLGTTNLTYTANVEVPLFTFTNSGTCTTGNIELMNNLSDPFRLTNSRSANVGQQLTTVGGGVDVAICLNTSYTAPCATPPVVCAISDEIQMTVVPKPVANVSVPTNVVCVGGNVTLSATITGGVGCSVQWQSSPQTPNNWIDIPSATANTYTTPNLNSTLKYRTRVICTGIGCCN
jgi:hypothetical protein